MKNDIILNEVKLIEDYGCLKELLLEWGSFIDKTLLRLISKDVGFDDKLNLEIKPSHRLKADEKLVKKAFYRGKDYKDPLLEITDKVGTRIVVTTRTDANKIRDIVKNNLYYWSVEEIKQVEDFVLIDPSKFGYQAVHFLLKPNKRVPFFKNVASEDLRYYICELQIKSLAQHAWAQISHDTTYKGPFGEDSNVTRTMAKIMALGEVVDDYFEEVITYMEKDDTYQKCFLDGLVKISSEELAYSFDKTKVDPVLTNRLFELINIKNYSLDNIVKSVKRNRSTLKSSLLKITSFLQYQPVVILLLVIILNRSGFILKEKWEYEEDVLRELFKSLNFSYNDK